MLAQRFELDLEAEPLDLYRSLRQVNPSPYMYLLQYPELAVVGSSPEPMVRVRDGRVISRPIAGTRRRGRTDVDDRRLAAELSEHPKERAEHVMLVDLARNDVGKVVDFGTETVDELMTLERYSHVMHLTSQVSGQLRAGLGPVDVLRATIPAGTVSGAPKVRAMEIIDELEPARRGPYAGCCGLHRLLRQRGHRHRHSHHARRQWRAGQRRGGRRHCRRQRGRNRGPGVPQQGGRPAGRCPGGKADRRRPRRQPSGCSRGQPGFAGGGGAEGRWEPVSNDGGYAALRHGTGALEVGRDVVRVSGPDAESYLQGQTSQDVAGLGAGASAWALVLQPQGKLDVFVRVFRLGPDEFLLDSDAGMGRRSPGPADPFQATYQGGYRASGVAGRRGRGPGAGPVPVSGDDGWSVAAPFEWSGLSGYDLLGPRPVPPAEATVVEPAAYEAVRVEAGFPVHGRELDERTIPAEAGLVEASVSFTKGCYTGQELVARIDSRGSNVPRHLRGLVLSGPAQAGARLYRVPTEDGPRAAPVAEGGDGDNQPASSGPSTAKEVGRLTSVALSPRLGWVALGYVARAVDLGTTLVAQDDNDEFEARVEPLPLA